MISCHETKKLNNLTHALAIIKQYNPDSIGQVNERPAQEEFAQPPVLNPADEGIKLHKLLSSRALYIIPEAVEWHSEQMLG